MDCPRCDGTLRPKTMNDAQVHVCDACTGTLVRQPDLVRLLEALAGPTLQVIDPDEPIEAMPDPGVHLPCPICHRTMDAFGYMGERTVIADRCGHDMVIWADAGELGTMSVLYARSNKNLMKRYRQGQEERRERQRQLHLQMTSRARADRVASAMLTGAGHAGAGYGGNVWGFLGLLFGRDDDWD